MHTSLLSTAGIQNKANTFEWGESGDWLTLTDLIIYLAKHIELQEERITALEKTVAYLVDGMHLIERSK